jgi:hypothetical protein
LLSGVSHQGTDPWLDELEGGTRPQTPLGHLDLTKSRLNITEDRSVFILSAFNVKCRVFALIKTFGFIKNLLQLVHVANSNHHSIIFSIAVALLAICLWMFKSTNKSLISLASDGHWPEVEYKLNSKIYLFICLL